MKKTLLVLTAMVILVSFARIPQEIRDEQELVMTNNVLWTEFRNNITVSEWRAVFDEAIQVASTNLYAAQHLVGALDFGQNLVNSNNAKALLEEYDLKLSAAGLTDSFFPRYNKTPKLLEAYFNSTNWWCTNVTSKCPLYIALTRKYKEGYAGTLLQSNQVQFPEYVNATAELIAHGLFISNESLEQWKQQIINVAPKKLRRAMRDQGKSFVATDNDNPLQTELDAFTAALNAPKFAGLKEWFAKWYPSYNWTDITWLDAETMQTLQDDIYYGDVEMTSSNRMILQSYLGVTAYNEFVNRFNGTTSEQ